MGTSGIMYFMNRLQVGVRDSILCLLVILHVQWSLLRLRYRVISALQLLVVFYLDLN